MYKFKEFCFKFFQYFFLVAMNDNGTMLNLTKSENLTRDYNDTCLWRDNLTETETCLDLEVEQGDYLYKVRQVKLINL